ncbi:hypothetical protein CDL12_28045 [Handroanthus impetiginosus]|uniref:Calmodulin-binding domain-containing protein n=1 Tax=Handroanthus impetiginosus TaxID=429701 RepID=A0A2G9G2D7_9LAMI|nr:hypothetical protein CDL12_28045 [Handroanthus impetiginosus]
MSVKHSSSLKLKLAKVEPLSASDNSDGVHGKARRNSGVSTVRKMTVSASAKKVLLPSAASSSPKFSLVKTTLGNAREDRGLKFSSCLKGPKRVHKVENEIFKSEASEKTLRVIKIGTEKDALESVPGDCGVPVLPSSSSPNSLSRAVFPCPLSREEDDEEIKFCGEEADEVVSKNTISMAVLEVQPANENHSKTFGTGTENKALKSIRDHRSSHKSLSHEEDDGNEADEFVSDNTEPMESVKIQPAKEKQNKIPITGTENDPLESIPDDNVPLPSSSSSDTSSHASTSSSFSHEEDDEQITHADSEADEIISDNAVPMEIVKEQPMKQNHNKTLRKSRSILSEDKHRSPVKLKFRSGRVLDIKPENNAPRRLKFRRTRANVNATDNNVSDKKKSIEIGSPQHVKENQTKSSRKSRVLVSEDKYRSPIKLFRTEKSLDPQSDNNNLRKLRFRRARELGAEDTKSDWRRRIFKRVGDKNDAAGAELSSRKVTLKHQDLQGKRDAQGLLNNVIEETASKLVESRKSKVKALVGAFETVISLQERKPSLRSVS